MRQLAYPSSINKTCSLSRWVSLDLFPGQYPLSARRKHISTACHQKHYKTRHFMHIFFDDTQYTRGSWGGKGEGESK
jgi:hypothetical protein